MIRVKNILVPTDFSEHSDTAVLYGCELASRFDADLHLLHVVEFTPLMYGEGAYFAPETEAQLEHDAQQLIGDIPAPEWRSRIPNVTRSTLRGHPLPEICRYAKEQNIDLIILGTHGRGAIAHVLLGSVAEKVVRKAPCPVLTVHHPEREFVMP
ncbi:MAG: universal stress protein [Planctomycetaceae bacterium]|nr:universal stress protein [Planctomycetaceae bacterium]